jgi:lysophospholipid acyltransferase (LPLAT)-like uncharacterized protein
MARLTIDKARLIGPERLIVRLFDLSTDRVIVHDPRMRWSDPSHHPMIFAMWHGQFMMLPVLNPSSVKVRIMVARHGDAEPIGGVLQQFGMDLIRGAGAADANAIAAARARRLPPGRARRRLQPA